MIIFKNKSAIIEWHSEIHTIIIHWQSSVNEVSYIQALEYVVGFISSRPIKTFITNRSCLEEPWPKALEWVKENFHKVVDEYGVRRIGIVKPVAHYSKQLAEEIQEYMEDHYDAVINDFGNINDALEWAEYCETDYSIH